MFADHVLARLRSIGVLVLVASLSLTAASCGSDSTDDGAAAPVESTTTGDGAGSDQPEQQTDQASSGDGAGEFCDLVTSVDLAAAFDGTLDFGEPTQYEGREVCIVPILGAEGDGLIVQTTIPGNYEAKAGYEDQSVPFTTIAGLGQEAFIVNDADLNVLIDDSTALVVAVSAFFTEEGATIPEPATVREGLTTVAEAVIAGR